MQMHHTLRWERAQPLAEEMAARCRIASAQADAVLRTVMGEFAWRIEQAALSRGGLADVVEMLGSVQRAAYPAGGLLRDEAASRDGEAILAWLLGTRHGSRTLAARAARQGGIAADQVAAMLPHLAVAAIGGLAVRCNAGLAEVLAQIPPLGRLSRGNPHADLAGILRRRCGAGSFSPRALTRAVRRATVPAAAPASRAVLVWYVRFMFARTTTTLLHRRALR